MYVLFIVLNKTEYLNLIIRKMKEIGISGATIIDTVGAGKLSKSIGKEIPFIGGLMKNLDGDIANNKTMFSVVDTKEQAVKIMDEIEKVCGGDMSKPNTGIMFLMPVEMVRGGSIGRKKEINKTYHAE